MRATFLGGASEIGASCTLLEIGNARIVVDAGIRISPKTSRGLSNDQLPNLNVISDVGQPDAILVTHAHTDHTGALPLLAEFYPETPIYATLPTIALMHTLLVDARRIMDERYRQEGELPLYDETATDLFFKSVRPIDFGQPTAITSDISATFHPAGHILGASMIALESEEGTALLTGDLSMTQQRTVDSPAIPALNPTWLITETTYGGRLHANRLAEEERLVQTLQAVIHRDGKVLIPAFALGRAQELIPILHAHRRDLPAPVYVDGMVRSICTTYSQFEQLLPSNTVRAAGKDDIFFRHSIRTVHSKENRQEIATNHAPCIIIASSGMLTGGASTFYARHILPNPHNALLLTGYQDEEAPGRRLQGMIDAQDWGEAPTIKVAGKQVPVRCTIDSYALSAHADETELVNMTTALEPRSVLLVHGDKEARASLATALQRRQRDIHLPETGQGIELAPDSRPTRRATTAQTQPAEAPRLLIQEVPQLAGQLVVIRPATGRPRPAIVLRMHMDSFVALTTKAEPPKAYPSEALVCALGAWRHSTRDERTWKRDLSQMTLEGHQLLPLVLPHGRRRQLRETKALVDIDRLLIEARLPAHVDVQTASLALALALAIDGAARTPGGLVAGYYPSMARKLNKRETRQQIVAAFPPAAELRKVALPDDIRQPITLYFCFPELAQERYGSTIAELEEEYERPISLYPQAHTPRLLALVDELRPAQTTVTKKAGVHHEERETRVGIEGLSAQEEAELAETYRDITGYALSINPPEREKKEVSSLAFIPATQNEEPLPQSTAAEHIRQALKPHGLIKLGQKPDHFLAHFVVPEQANDHQTLLQSLADETGHTIKIHPHANPAALMKAMRKIAQANRLKIAEKISLYQPERRAVVTLKKPGQEAALEKTSQEIAEEYAYQIEIAP